MSLQKEKEITIDHQVNPNEGNLRTPTRDAICNFRKSIASVLSDQRAKKIEQIICNGPLRKAIPAFQGFLRNLAYTGNTEAVVIFGSSISDFTPRDIDFLVVTADEILSPDFWSISECKHYTPYKALPFDTDPELEFNGKLPLDLRETGATLPGIYGPEVSKQKLENLIYKLKTGQEECIVITFDQFREKYTLGFQNSYFISVPY